MIRTTALPLATRTAVRSPKLLPPALPPRFVERPRLQQALEQATAGRVTLLSSHAGTGKTVLLASWLAAHAGSRIAWLSLDRDDNSSPHLWSGVELALACADPAAFGLQIDGSASSAPLRVAERAAACDGPITLVLDDVHELENRLVLRELQALVDHAPSQLRLVLSTRADPGLRLQRLRLTDDLAEIRAADLAFTLDECRGLLKGLADELSDEDLELLRARTEGWAAGLRLAELSLAGSRDRRRYLRRFAGDDRAVADYLLNEVLDRQTAQRREFLLRTSVPDVLTAELADELSGRTDGGRVLSELEAANLVVSSRGEFELHYRFHGLLLEFLRAQLRLTRPRDLALLHRRSARWHWAAREPIPAFRDAVAGRDWSLADEISGDAWHVVAADVGQPALAAVPPSALAGRPCLCLQAALTSLAAGDRPEAERRLEAGRQSLLDGGPRLGAPLLILQVDAALAKLDGAFDSLEELASELLHAPLDGGFDRAAQARAQRAIALCHLGTAELAAGRLGEADSHLESALDLARSAGLDAVAVEALSELALLETSRGRLRRAVEFAADAVELAEIRGWSERAPAVAAHLVLGWAHYQWDDLPSAEQWLDRAATASCSGTRTGQLAATVLSSLVCSTDGSRGAAEALVRLRGARSELDKSEPRVLASVVETAEARLLVARGDVDAARHAVESCADDSGAPALIRARLHLADGRPDEALGELARFDATPSGQLALQIEADVLNAVARHALHDEGGAGEVLERALGLAGPNNYRRPFLDGGPAVRTLLVQRIRNGTAHRSFVAELQAAFEKRAPNVELERTAMLEPLSAREAAVLRYLPTMMSNVEIAAELFVTSNTIKTHLKSIYRKLGVARRRDAVERARKLELL